MAQWGRNGQAITANSTTTKETSNGAPIGMYNYVKGGKNQGISHATNAAFGNTSPGSDASVDAALWQNTTPGAFINNMAVGVFSVSATQESNNQVNNSKESPAHAGWNLRRAGTGSIASISYTGTATGYTNGELLIVASPVAGGNASYVISTNTTGGALTFTVNSAGFGFTAVNPAVTLANSTGGATTTGTGATFVATAGGRAGRVHYETIVAMGSLGAQTAIYGTPAVVQSPNTAQFPGN